jgi:hypothetical protein
LIGRQLHKDRVTATYCDDVDFAAGYLQGLNSSEVNALGNCP